MTRDDGLDDVSTHSRSKQQVPPINLPNEFVSGIVKRNIRGSFKLFVRMLEFIQGDANPHSIAM